MIHHDIALRPWEVLGADVFHFSNNNYLCIVDYHSKFPVIKKMEGLSTESLIATAKVIFAEYGIPCKIMSDAGTNYVSDKFCSRLNIKQAVLSTYHHQSNGQLKPALNSLNAHLKMCQLQWGHSHGIITNLYYPTGAWFAKSSNIAI